MIKIDVIKNYGGHDEEGVENSKQAAVDAGYTFLHEENLVVEDTHGEELHATLLFFEEPEP